MDLFWRISYTDLKSKIKLYTGQKQASVVQDFQSMAEVMKMAFGSEEKEKTDLKPVESFQELARGFNAVFG